MTKPKVVKEIPSTITKVDITTGKETHGAMSWKVLPPSPDKCQICAHVHEPGEPHNAQTAYYQMLFQSMVGRAPTWADAMAHCDANMKRAWTHLLKEAGHWTEPPEGEIPVAHHGVG